LGTIRQNRRGFPNDLKRYVKTGFPKRGDCEICQSKINSNLTVAVWQDTKPVTICSTMSQSVPLDEVSRKLRNGDHETFPCPHAITTYNKFMGGVDKNDQLREYYHVRLKSHKYYKYLFWMVFDIAVTNGLILAKNKPNLKSHTKSLKAFRSQLATELLEGYCSRKKRGRRPSVNPTKRFCGTHFPLHGEGKQRRCEHCKLQNVRKDTIKTSLKCHTWYCSDCDLYFCHKGNRDNDCFLLYHNKYIYNH
jgi:hypothetical protein